VEIVERDVVRVVVLDGDGRVLLFHTRDPTAPARGTWWELPGGGMDPGETHAETAVRELAEEAGLRVTPTAVGPPTWRRRASYPYRGRRYVSHEVVVLVRLDRPGPAVDPAGRVEFEGEDYFADRWWPVAEVRASTEQFYPGRLPGLLDRFLAGERIDEPDEYWS
jgi:8-oxo-dGTP pyrophosphatase MutT (NUDIX family)